MADRLSEVLIVSILVPGFSHRLSVDYIFNASIFQDTNQMYAHSIVVMEG